MSIYTKLAFTLLGFIIVFNWGLLMSATLRKIVARVAGRHGIPFYQPWIDLVKNLIKLFKLFLLKPIENFIS